MSSKSSINTISLSIEPDYYLLIYPFVILALIGASLYLSAIYLGLKYVIFLLAVIVVSRFVYKDILLKADRAIRKIELKEEFYLSLKDGTVEKCSLLESSVITTFMLMLVFKGQHKHKIIIRRTSCNAQDYDALFIYINTIWKKDLT